MTDVLTALDATFLELEQHDEGALMHIGAILVFDPMPDGGVPSVDELCADLAVRLESLPRYGQRLSEPRTGGLSWPHWEEDPNFDIRAHVSRVALPAPGGDAELCDWVGDFYSHRLDRTRPLWEIALVEGLSGGRWALAHKTHHCLVDGVGSVGVATVLLDTSPTPTWPTGLAQREETGSSLRDRLMSSVPDAVTQAGQTGVHAARASANVARHPRETLAKSRSLAELLIRDELVAAPQSSVNAPIGSTRRFAAVTAPLAELKAIGHGLGGSVNDVALAACTSGLRRLLLARQERPPHSGLRAMVPMNLRENTERLALGNRISTLFVDLPVAEPVAHRRFRAIHDATDRLKHSGAAEGAVAMIDLAAYAPPAIHATLARSLYATRLFNVTVTNVPGPQFPLYCFGAQLREAHPIVPLAADHAVGIAIFSYNGIVSFGVIADCDSTPDLDQLAYGIEEGLAELLELIPDGARPSPDEQKRTLCQYA